VFLLFRIFSKLSTLSLYMDPQTLKAKAPANLIRVPTCRQSTNWTCGVAALQSILQYFGDEWREDRLAAELKSSSEYGTEYHMIVKFAESQGYKASSHLDLGLDQLKKHIDSAHPVIIALQAWADADENNNYDWKNKWEDGHYVVVIGYDSQNIYVMDPSTLGNYAFVPIEEFLERWHDTDGKTNAVCNQLGLVIYKETAPVYDPIAVLRML